MSGLQAYRLSPDQARVWALQKDGQVYRTHCAYAVDGPIDITRFKAVWKKSVEGLEILRTTFCRRPGMPLPLQTIAQTGELSWSQIDLGSYDPEHQKSEFDRILREASRQPFDLEHGPLLRLCLISLETEKYILTLELPSLCADVSSVGSLVDEVFELYADGEGKPCEAKEPLQYADFAEWHHQLLDESVEEAGIAFWQQQDLSAVPKPNLAWSTAEGATAPALECFSLKRIEGGAAKARALTDRYGVAMSDFYLACVQALVARMSNRADVVIGAVPDDRGHASLDGAVGLFARTLPIYFRFEDGIRFDEVLLAIGKKRKSVADWQYYYSWDVFQPPRETEAGPPYLPVGFEYQLVEKPRRCGEISYSVCRQSARTDRFDLKFVSTEKDGSLSIDLYYDTARFTREDVERLARQYQTLLISALDNPKTAVYDLEVLDESELKRILFGFNQTDIAKAEERCVHELIEVQVERSPDSVAVVFEDQVLTYGQLNRRSNRLAHQLRSLGVGPDVPVGLCVERSLDMIVGVLGILKAGGAYLPLDPSLPEERLSFLLAETQVPALVTQRLVYESLPETAAEVLLVDEDTSSEFRRRTDNVVSGVNCSNLVYIMFTSGSTGKPKGVSVEHRQLVNYIDGVGHRLECPEVASFATVSTIAADLGNTAIFSALCTGGCLHVVSDDRITNPDAFAEYFAGHTVDCLKIVPSHLEALLGVPDPQRVLPTERLIVGGEATSWELVRRLRSLKPACVIINHYGPTESTVGVLAYRQGHSGWEEHSGTLPLGRPLANSRVHLLDRRMLPVPVGVPGELYIGGEGLARGYHCQAGQTAERFVANPFGERPGTRLYKTGDVARYLPDGNVEFLGRADDQVKIRGFRVELGEIETILTQQPGVREAVVLARESTTGDRMLVAYLITERERGPKGGEIRDALKRQLPEYMLPSTFVVLEKLPLTRNGKVDRTALPAPGEVQAKGERQIVRPRTPNEEKLIQIWAEVLGRQDLSVHDDFFELGGHSLLAMQLIARTRTAFGVELLLPALFDTPTVAGLAEFIELTIDGGATVKLSPLHPVSRMASLPLSFAQQRLWFLDQLEPNDVAYNRPWALRLTGLLNPATLEQTLGEIVRRHEVLRTTFSELNGSAVQMIADEQRVPLALRDLSALPQQKRDHEAQRLAFEEAHRSFNLGTGPLLRACLLRLDDADHVLLLSQHHINTDAWSNGVMAREVSALYESFSTGRSSPLADLNIQYADYAAWQREWLESEGLQEQLSYWKKELRNVPPLLELPTDRPRATTQSSRGDRRDFSLSKGQSRSLEALSSQGGATLFMTLLAAFQTLMFRYTGQTDILVGTPIAGRNLTEIEDLIGFFVNTLVIRADFDGDPGFRELLAQVRKRALDAFANQDLPFEKLIGELDVDRDLSRTPLFQVMFSLQKDVIESVALRELRLSPMETPFQTAKFDLTLHVLETDEGLKGSLEYNADLFNAATIERMVEHLKILVEGITTEPEKPISELPLLSKSEQRQLLVDWNPTAPSYSGDLCIHELFQAQVQKTPDQVALVCDAEQLTYRELDARANRLARHLRRLGVGPDETVGVCMERSLEMLVGLLGILKAGGSYVPLDPSYPKERLAFMSADAGLRILVTMRPLLKNLDDNDMRFVCLDTDWWAIAQESGEEPGVETSLDNLAYVIYTSGSTGRPKGTTVSHRNVARLFSATEEWFHFSRSEDVWTLFHSYAFDFSVWEIWGALCFGGRLVVVPFHLSRSPEEFHRFLFREGVTVLNQTPSAFRSLASTDAEMLGDPGGLPLRLVIFGGEALDVNYLKPWFDRHGSESPRLVNMYGITETTVHVTYLPVMVTQMDAAQGSQIGRPIRDLQIHVLDRNRELLPIGVVGEIYVGGGGLARGYLDRPELTAERFVANPFSARPGARLYRTGDLARYLPNGNLEYLGRIDDQVQIRGFRIELGEIEIALCQHPSIREAVVVALEDRPGVSRLVAYLTYRPNLVTTTSELRAHLNAKLPAYMVPAAFVILESLPLTMNGKINRKALPAPDQTRPDLEEALAAPVTAAEEALAGIWARVLGLDRVGRHDNFFQLGGDSILTIQIVSKANQAGIRLTPKDIFQNQTIAELAAMANTADPTIHLDQGLVTGPIRLTAIQQWFFDRHTIDPHHFNQAVLVQAKTAVDPELLERALGELLVHHDALRLRFVKEGSVWQQSGAPPSQTSPLSTMDLSALPGPERVQAMNETMARLQASLDLSQGTPFRASLFTLGAGEPSRLFIMAHHLVVDGVSWRIVLEDLQTVYEQLCLGETIRLPSKTTSFAEFSKRCHELANADDLELQLAYWLDGSRTQAPDLPLDNPTGSNTVASSRSVALSLDAEETRQLLREVPDVYHTQINDVLLTALLGAFSKWTGHRSLLVDLEGHGREEIFDDIDLSRTVGWFTAIFPVLLESSEAEDQAATLKHVKEQLRAIPDRGVGYGLLRYLSGSKEQAKRLASMPQAQVSFNYLGQVDQALAESSWFEWVRESTGPSQSVRAQRSHLLEVTGIITEGCLQMSFRYSEDIHRQQTIEHLAGQFMDGLRSLIEHCQSPEAGGYTPSDFVLAELTQDQIDQHFSVDRGVEDIYPLSPLQEGLLFHSLQAPRSGAYLTHMVLKLNGSLDVGAFKRAWESVIARHTALRTGFEWQELNQPLQVVYHRAELPWLEEDWRDVDEQRQLVDLQEFLRADRIRGFELSKAPLIRLALLRISNDAYQFVWSHHHLVIDGWSVPLILREVLAFYTGLVNGDGGQLESPRPYRDFIAWLKQQDLLNAEAYWRRSLAGIETPTLIGGFEHYDDQVDEIGNEEHELRLTETETRALRAFAQENDLTVNTVAQGAWALLLAGYTGEEDVVYGAALSGRPASLHDVATIPGMFTNTLPVRVKMEPEVSVVGWLKLLQTQQVELREFEYSPLVQVQGWSQVPRSMPLFDVIFAFQNYPVETALIEKAAQDGLNIELVLSQEQSTSPLTVFLVLQEVLRVKLVYDRHRFSNSRIARMGDRYLSILKNIVDNGEAALMDLRIGGDLERPELPMISIAPLSAE